MMARGARDKQSRVIKCDQPRVVYSIYTICEKKNIHVSVYIYILCYIYNEIYNCFFPIWVSNRLVPPGTILERMW